MTGHVTPDRITKPFARFLGIEAAAGGLLLRPTITALVVANTAAYLMRTPSRMPAPASGAHPNVASDRQ